MKTAAIKSFAFFSLFAFLAFGISINAVASEVVNHEALASQYENLAQDMQAKVEEQKDIVNHKPRTSYFGKHGQNINSHIAYKIRKYEKAAAEYSQQAAYHHKIAADQAELKAIATKNQSDGKDAS
jgi:hypothetical protein